MDVKLRRLITLINEVYHSKKGAPTIFFLIIVPNSKHFSAQFVIPSALSLIIQHALIPIIANSIVIILVIRPPL